MHEKIEVLIYMHELKLREREGERERERGREGERERDRETANLIQFDSYQQPKNAQKLKVPFSKLTCLLLKRKFYQTSQISQDFKSKKRKLSIKERQLNVNILLFRIHF